MWLAIGLNQTFVLLWSCFVKENSEPSETALILSETIKTKGCCKENKSIFPDVIWIIENGRIEFNNQIVEPPDVRYKWYKGRDY